MAMITQGMFDDFVQKASFRRNGTGFKELLELYMSFSDSEKRSLDFSKMHEKMKFNLHNADIDLDVVYALCDGNEELLAEVNSIARESHGTRLLYQYIKGNELSDEEFVELSVRAVKNVLPDEETEVGELLELRGMAVERGLLDDIVTGIKTSGDIETVVCGALCYEPKLIDDVFGGKSNMYLYLRANTFTDDECITFFIDRLLTMDDGELEESMTRSAQAIDAKIMGKKIQ